MSESTNHHSQAQPKRNDRSLKFLLVLLLIVGIACPAFYCWFIPVTTGQFCPDIASGHIPTKAEEIFLSKLFEATVKKDYEWLATISSEEALMQLQDLQPLVTKGFKIVSVDDLSGMYERTIEFENGNAVYLTFHGSWSCPDFEVIEQEVFENIKLTYIEKRE